MRSKSKKSLRVESMEPRRMMAVVGNVDLLTGDLLLQGDVDSDRIVIETIAAGTYRVTGEAGTTIDGKAYEDFYVWGGDVEIHMGEGDDRVRLDDVTTTDNITIATDNGSDEVQVVLSNLDGVTSIDTGASDVADDIVDIKGSTFIELAIATHDGDDDVVMHEVHVQGNTNIDLGAGDDFADIRLGTFGSGAKIVSAAGNDVVQLDSMLVNGELIVQGNEGDDNVTISNSTMSKTTMHGGDGFDVVTVEGNSFSQRVYVAGGKGADDIDSHHNEYAGDLIVRTHEGRDSVKLTNDQIGRDLDIATGSHADDVDLEGVIVERNTKIALDAANDTLDAALSLFKGNFVADGGLGDDFFLDISNGFLGTKRVRRF